MKTRFSPLHSSKGAIDLASIMVGVIAVGLVGGVVAATIFAVIPWAQDNAAKMQISNISAAQSAYSGMADGSSNGEAEYGLLTDSASTLATEKLMSADYSRYCSMPNPSGSGYVTYAKSGSGKTFVASDSSAPKLYEGPSSATCFEASGLPGGSPVTPSVRTKGSVISYISMSWGVIRDSSSPGSLNLNVSCSSAAGGEISCPQVSQPTFSAPSFSVAEDVLSSQRMKMLAGGKLDSATLQTVMSRMYSVCSEVGSGSRVNASLGLVSPSVRQTVVKCGGVAVPSSAGFADDLLGSYLPYGFEVLDGSRWSQDFPTISLFEM